MLNEKGQLFALKRREKEALHTEATAAWLGICNWKILVNMGLPVLQGNYPKIFGHGEVNSITINESIWILNKQHLQL